MTINSLTQSYPHHQVIVKHNLIPVTQISPQVIIKYNLIPDPPKTPSANSYTQSLIKKSGCRNVLEFSKWLKQNYYYDQKIPDAAVFNVFLHSIQEKQKSLTTISQSQLLEGTPFIENISYIIISYLNNLDIISMVLKQKEIFKYLSEEDRFIDPTTKKFRMSNVQILSKHGIDFISDDQTKNQLLSIFALKVDSFCRSKVIIITSLEHSMSVSKSVYGLYNPLDIRTLFQIASKIHTIYVRIYRNLKENDFADLTEFVEILFIVGARKIVNISIRSLDRYIFENIHSMALVLSPMYMALKHKKSSLTRSKP